MKYAKQLIYLFLSSSASILASDPSNGLAPEVTDLNAVDISYTLEKKIPYLEQAYISSKPQNLKDGIPVGKLGIDGGDKEARSVIVQVGKSHIFRNQSRVAGVTGGRSR